ncbi:MAG TPA: hypothetical protein VFL55_22210 [Acetobacteraceae bacterium]|nr:hypothetical protein [Acetobacteraceae bacterium]
MIALLLAATGLIVAVIGSAIIDPSGQSTWSLLAERFHAGRPP